MTITGNTLSINRSYWNHVITAMGMPAPPAAETQQIIKDTTSIYSLSHITVTGNHR